MNQISTILWDLDGTLVNSEYIHDEAVVHACEIMDMPFDVSKMLPGQDAVTVFELVCGEQVSLKNEHIYYKWYDLAIQYTYDNFHKACQISQTIELVHEFARLGMQQSIVSNTISPIIYQCVDGLDIKPHIANFIGRDKVCRGKPSPEPYILAMQLHNVLPENCLVFEDSYTGMQAAMRAGIKIVGVGDHVRDLPVKIDHICSFQKSSWLDEIRDKYLYSNTLD